MVVDDHEVVRAGLARLLGRSGKFRLVSAAATVADAMTEARRLRPDVVLMDLRLPDGSGIEACREILESSPSTRVLFLTSYSDEEAVAASVLARASGYLLKSIGRQALVHAIQAVADGQSILDPQVMRPALVRLRDAVAPSAGRRLHDLSPQEKRVLGLVVEGRTNKEIAAALNLSDKTVKNYLSNAFQKLQVQRRSHAAAVFIRAGTDG